MIPFWKPQYWLIGTALLLLRGFIYLPYRTQLKLGRTLGRWTLPFARRSRRIAEINLQCCFPDLSAAERHTLLVKNFESAGITFFETGMAWWASQKKLNHLLTVHGVAHLEAALKKGKGVIFCSAHLMALEICGRLLAQQLSFAVMYRPHKNPLLNKLNYRHRKRHYQQIIAREDLRGMLRTLKNNQVIWYTPDIDAGAKNSVFVPFFGVLAATVTATSRLAKLSGARVVPVFFYRRDDDSGYDLHIEPALECYPSDDVVHDALRVNQLIEKAVLKKPEQYLWQYRRFKTRPEGEARFYK